MPGDKSIAHRAALLSILAKGPLQVRDFPDGHDCRRSLEAAKIFGVRVEDHGEGNVTLTPPDRPTAAADVIVDCGNSGTTARLLSGIVAGSDLSVIISGDDSLSQRPMQRIVKPLTEMGAEVYDTEGHLPVTIRGKKLLPFEYRLPVASAQVKSCLLLAGLASGCSMTVQEVIVSRDHTELMIQALGGNLSVREIKPVYEEDPSDPRKRRRVMPEPFKREIAVGSGCTIGGGDIDIPGDFSTAAYFLAAAALSGKSITIEQVGLNPTRTAFLDHLKAIGCTVEVQDKVTLNNEARGTVTVVGGSLKSRKISGEITVGLIDEIPILAALAAYADGTTIIRDAAELRVKESNRLVAIATNLESMGVHCGVVEDGLVIEGGKEPQGADLQSFGDHRIAMAFSVAALFATGPSTIDDENVVSVSCPNFYDMVKHLTK